MRTMKLRRHTPPLPATRRESTAAHPPPLRCAHGSGPPRLRMEAPSTAMPAAPAVYAPRLGPAGSACVSLPAQFSRLRRLPFAAVAHAGCAYTASALGMAYRKAYLRRRVDTSRRRALRYGRWAAAPSRSPAGGGGVWGPLVTGSAGAWGASEPRETSGARAAVTCPLDPESPPDRDQSARRTPPPPVGATEGLTPATLGSRRSLSACRPPPMPLRPSPRPRRTTWRDTPSPPLAPRPPRPCPASSRRSCP